MRINMPRHDDLAMTEIKVFDHLEEAEKTAENLASLAYPGAHAYPWQGGWLVIVPSDAVARYLRRDGVVR
jgi:hypothetical protein